MKEDDILVQQEATADDEPTAGAAPPKLHLHFMDLAGDDIAGMNVRVTIWDQGRTYCTDQDGIIDDIEGSAGARLRIEVQRFDGSFKLIDDTFMPASPRTWWQFVSPQVLIEVQTEDHEGESGNIEDSIPIAVPSDQGQRPMVHTSPEFAAISEPETQPAQVQTPPAKAPSPPKEASSTATQPASALPAISGKTGTPVRNTEVKIGRTEQGTPMTVLQRKMLDWWNSWTLPTLNLWGAHTNATGEAVAVSNPSAGTASAGSTAGSKVPFNSNMLPKVKSLIDFATAQTEYDYSVGTAAVLAQMVKGTFNHAAGEKRGSLSKGKCYQYVRIALTRAQIVSGYLADTMDVAFQESASKAGEPLVGKGFADVTDEVPDARWAATGDVIVYEWSPGTWAERKKKKGLPAMPNHGHIDIRSEETYISDFISDLKHPGWVVGDVTQPTKYRPEYVNIRIFRKFYDPTPTCRIRAFLACLREFECQAIKNDADRYTALNMPLPANPKSMAFAGFASHPWADVPKDKWPASTAAGAYQITCTTWREELDRRYFADADGKATFTPQMQDRLAVRRLEFRKALHSLRAGRLDEAVATARNEWTSLPGSAENSNRRTADGKPMDMGYLKSLFGRFLATELAKFGIGVK